MWTLLEATVEGKTAQLYPLQGYQRIDPIPEDEKGCILANKMSKHQRGECWRQCG
jgi:hypothetical protein